MRHAAPTTVPLTIPAYYLSDCTQDYPYLLLLTSEGDGYAADDLPVAHGVSLMVDARNPNAEAYALIDTLCEACSTPVAAEAGLAVEVEASGGGNPLYLQGYHATCLLAGDIVGLVPRASVTLVPVE